MNEEKKYTEREKILAEREAFVNGADWLVRAESITLDERRSWCAQAARQYKLPNVSRPRVRQDPHDTSCQWSFQDGQMLAKVPRGDWTHARYIAPDITPERVTLWSDLIATPTEMVEEEG